VIDPVEELNRQDLATLLEQAMRLLPTSTRQAIELSYLADLPPHEVASRLGLTVNAVEVRLHRARHQIRRALYGELRAEAETLGLALDQDIAVGWRETREWCHICGQRRLHGLLEPQPEGRVLLRLRCPDCSPRFCDMFASSQKSAVWPHSFRSAYKHIWKVDFANWRHTLEQGRRLCSQCRTQIVPLQIVRPLDLDFPTPFPDTYRTILICPTCGITGTCSIVDLLVHPDLASFTEARPRWVIGAESVGEYAGEPVIRTCLSDRSSAARLIVIAHRRTLEVLATFPD
jgi:Sigma-70, region 4